MPSCTLSRVGTLTCSAFFGLGVFACGASDGSGGQAEAETGAAVTEWPASDAPQRILHVQTWKLLGTVGDGELVGLGGAADPKVQSVRVHARIQRGEDARIMIDVDVPKEWHFTFRPGNLPTMSGDAPSEVALALASSALDAPEPADANASALVAAQSLRPLASPPSGGAGTGGALVGKPSCLVQSSQQLTGQANAAGYKQTIQTAADAYAKLREFPACQVGGGVPDPGNKSELTAYAACLTAVNIGGCDGSGLYKLLLGASN